MKTMRLAAWLLGLFLAAVFACELPAQEAQRDDAGRITSLRELQRVVTAGGRAIVSFRVEGVVCAESARGTLVLQDASAAVFLELPGSHWRAKVGDGLVVEGSNCTLTRGPFGIQVGTAPVVEIDGLHHPISRSGKVFLDAGQAPLRVEWFNGWDDAHLELLWEGAGTPRTTIPDSVLWRQNEMGKLEPGLAFATYRGGGWVALPDFSKLTPTGTGAVANFDINRRAQPQDCAMVFTGFLQVSNAGVYRIHALSDDGCRVYLGNPAAHCSISVSTNQARIIAVRNLSESISDGSDLRWSQIEGEVDGVRERSGLVELEISLGQRPFTVMILNPSGLATSNLFGATVRVTGIHQQTWEGNESWPARLVVPGPEQVMILNAPGRAVPGDWLTSISGIRALALEQARKGIRVRLTGIVTMADRWSFVLQDGSGGIYLRYETEDWVNLPQPGEVWEVEGVTDAGDFSPVVVPKTVRCLGYAALPRGIRPTWSEFMNGSLDAEQVEIEAAVTAVSASSLTLLTRDGTVTLRVGGSYALPSEIATVQPESLVGRIVRLRGVYAAEWDQSTHLVKPGEFWLGNALLSFVESAPGDGFNGEIRRVSDLLLFKSQAAGWGRIKLAGVTLHSRPGEYILFDGSGSIRVYTKEPQDIQEGDWVEVVGFPQLAGLTPSLLQAEARMRGSAPWPEPVELSAQDLPGRSHDARLVRLEALLLSDTLQSAERVLELQAGRNHFLGRLRSSASLGATARPGSRLQLTGVYSSVEGLQTANNNDAFELLLSRPTDIVVLQRGPWWTLRRIVSAALILAMGLVLALGWVGLLRRRVTQRTTQLKREIETRQVVEQRRVLEEERSRVAQDLHDDLGAGLAEVAILGALANNPAIQRDKQEGYLRRLTELARLLVTGLDEIVWAVNPRHDSHASVSGYLCDYAQEFLTPTGIACRLDVARDLPERALNAHERHQLFLAFKEALTNVVKHARATEVWVRIGADEQAFWVVVDDNGLGLGANEARQDADGLANMQKRMHQIGGECDIMNKSGGGTVVHFRLNLKRTATT